MFTRKAFAAAAHSPLLVLPNAARAAVLSEDFTEYAGFKSRWFGANSNALPYNRFDLADRGANGTGWSASDGEFGPNGEYNSTRVDIRFNQAFAQQLTSFSFDVLSYNDQLLQFYDLAGNVLFSQQPARSRARRSTSPSQTTLTTPLIRRPALPASRCFRSAARAMCRSTTS
jgi:hypothetical protein